MAQVQLDEDDAIDVLLLRAIETEDSNALVLTQEDRRYASASAQPLANSSRPHAATGTFLSTRARFALERVIARYPMVERVRGLSRWPHWVSWAVPLAALFAGLVTDVLGSGKELNILAFPLLTLIAWNFAVYVVLAVHAIRRATNGHRAQHPLRGALEWVIRPASARLAGQPTLERAIVRFAGDWSRAAGGITHARASRTLHLSAALLAIGILIGMLVRARYASSYTAGWSGTWAGAETEISLMLKVLLGPASAITHIPLPGVERLRELRVSRENAGNWLYLWAVTAALFVVVPRLIFAAASGAKTRFLARRFSVADDFYVRSLMRNAIGGRSDARVVPYGIDLDDEQRERAVRVLTAALGENTRVSIDPSVAYGSEDEWLSGEGRDLPASDHVVLLFNAASTPEAENQGALIQGVRRGIDGTGAQLLVLLEDSKLRRRLGTGASAERRLQERHQLWEAELAASAVSPISVSLNSPDETAAAQAIEKALLGARHE